MRQKECVHCGDAIVIADKDEQIVDGETPLEHLDRTGHVHEHTPQATGCSACGYLWMYQGGADRATCPNCKSKAEPGVVPPVE